MSNPDAMMSDEAIKAIEINSAKTEFFAMSYKTMARIVVWQAITVIVLIIAFAGIIISRPAPNSYAVSPDGKVTKLIPISEGVGAEAILDFAGKALISCYTMDFAHWRDQVGKLAPLFTDSGYGNFTTALKPLIDRIEAGRYVSSVAIAKPPVIAKSAVVDGAMKYKLQAQILVAFDGQSKKINPQLWDVTMIVDRVDMAKSLQGIQISSLIAVPTN